MDDTSQFSGKFNSDSKKSEFGPGTTTAESSKLLKPFTITDSLKQSVNMFAV